ncbi:MAG: bifunctional folylpolyglutamate synthase/dihydrofolate synthase [Lachnospiraceae bacterium]|nr:bifunctional folylpolyglutamate synthase/dihydrofolate synthase [Lachnospiraceae bacterium]
MTYKEALEYIHGLYWRGKKNGLEKTKELLELCGHPENGLRFVHIAGTNGKGSCAAMLASVCQSAGLKTGLYTSPYIVRYNERILVNGEEIPDGRLAALTEYLAEFVEKMEVPPSEFEFGTVLAFLYFQEQQCDIVILETGLGGTFDSTNVIQNPLLCIITTLGLDHTKQLGNTITEIAQAKAGIIKRGAPVVFYGETKEGEAVIRSRCEELSVPLVLPDFKEIVPERIGTPAMPGEQGKEENCQQFSYKQWQHITLALCGLYQQKNAALVLEAAELLRTKGLGISSEAMRKGLRTVHWQARLEVLRNNPLLLVDGSHNPQGMRATVESLRQYFPERKLQFIFGVMADKEPEALAELFLPLAKKVYVTAPAVPRAMKAEELLALCERLVPEPGRTEFVLCPTVESALAASAEEAPDEVIAAVGSLYLAGEIKKAATR